MKTAVVSVSEKLIDQVGALSIFLCKESFFDGQSSSTLLVYYSAILGLCHAGSTFDRPGNYAPKLSALIYSIRLCLLESCLPRFEHSLPHWPARPRTRQLEQLERVRTRFMCLSCQAPLGEFVSLRSYGRVVARSEGPRFRVSWSDDSQTISWDGGHFTMDQFRRLGSEAVRSATDSANRLLYGLHPSIDLKQIKDRFSNTAQGYSFLEEPVNKLKSAYLELSRRACLDPIDGLMVGEDWNHTAVRRYLTEEDHLLSHLMMIMLLRGGQGPRATELFSLQCYNSASTNRGIYIYGGAVAYITEHTKARKATNHEFYVVRYLPKDESELLVKYLAYIRPFAGMLRRSCYYQVQPRPILFSHAETANQPWTADRLTGMLKKLSMKVCGVAFGARLYRQLSIAITEKHIRQCSRPFHRYDDKTIVADIDVAFAWQSGHRPMQRGISYGTDSAFPDALQPALLRVYQWVSIEWHKFLIMDSGHRSSLQEELSPRQNLAGITGCKRNISSLEEQEQEQELSAGQLVGVGISPRQKRRTLPWLVEAAQSPSTSRSSSTSNSMKIERYMTGSVNMRQNNAKEDIFQYLPPYQVLICRIHQYAVRNFRVHLRDKHGELDIEQRRALLDQYRHVVLAQPGAVVQPTPFGPAFDSLMQPMDGFYCCAVGCDWTSISWVDCKKHCNTVHNCRWKDHRQECWQAVKCQTFFNSGGLRRCFPVVI